jgi:carbonic anhydrase/acetyltransferase-like protein (isoleucine patch superfamily)
VLQISIGHSTTIGDRATLLTVKTLDSEFPAVLTVGNDVIIKPGATLVSCEVQDGAIIGENAVVLEGVRRAPERSSAVFFRACLRR